ncbi:predicted protein [Verticillium alfalfae VaMs.102]|uniref:Predicted protein n=1 Tax=Verticillium alfalfae (strain VaMs.102 / ATCC MYA-4576 / FGSC 10136) TaxID=526221 RepID=C9S632_VERA1|nr:predicted protein [Verticillium alfalfae VaMs.102]EEY14371.1 predicted protein [Verticillium alfalfae VaMs.102]
MAKDGRHIEYNARYEVKGSVAIVRGKRAGLRVGDWVSWFAESRKEPVEKTRCRSTGAAVSRQAVSNARLHVSSASRPSLLLAASLLGYAMVLGRCDGLSHRSTASGADLVMVTDDEMETTKRRDEDALDEKMWRFKLASAPQNGNAMSYRPQILPPVATLCHAGTHEDSGETCSYKYTMNPYPTPDIQPLAFCSSIFELHHLMRKRLLAPLFFSQSCRLVVLGVLGVSEIVDDRRVRAGTTTVAGEDALKVDGAVEAEAAIVVDVDPVSLVVTGGVDDGDVAGLDKVASDEQVLLIGADLDIVRADDGLGLLGVIKALDVGEVRNIKSSDVVAKGDGEVGETAVVRNVRIDGERVDSLGARE